MSDLISREELKKTIKRMESLPWGDEKGNRVEFVWTSELVEHLIDKAPSAEPKWIPVTERLPLLPELHKKPYYVDFESELYDSDWVLVCCYVRKEPVYVVSQIIYDAKCDTYEWAKLYDYAECDIDDGAVVAWMPLPEAYEPGVSK